MKRVVNSSQCDKYKVYLAHISDNSWAMFKEMPTSDFRLMRIYDSTEYCFGISFVTLQECINQAILDGWAVHEFETFRSAMQYYLEQTK